MSIGAILDTLLFKPLQLVFEMIYMIANRVIENPGLSIIVLSLVMNFLVLPLYKRADAMQEEERDMEMRLRDGVAHIKKTFKGDERMMMLQTYYRQNDYKPTYVLKGAVSLFLEIPFFIAAYRFLSGLQLLEGVSFGAISDLASPDGLLVIGGVTINILPIIMTAVNMVSCVIFTKGSSMKQKIQLYGMAVFFLVFLYTSPSGLVFYWTLNNLFSLIKTIFYKIKNPAKILSVMFSITGVCVLVYGLFFYHMPTVKRTLFFIICSVLLQIPIFYIAAKDKVQGRFKINIGKPDRSVFFAGGCFMSVLTGLLIPSAVIQASPQEFIDVNYYYNPLWFVVSALCFAIGVFVIWAGVFYWLAKPEVKVLFERGIWIIAGISVVNYMFFGKNLGILNSELKYEQGLGFGFKAQIWNAAVMALVIVLFCFMAVRVKRMVLNMLVIATLAVGGMSVMNMVHIDSAMESIKEQAAANGEIPEISLSKNGKNVVVFMLDRAVGEYVPYIFNEKPELQEKFAGFTYYPNTISFGGFTNFGAPALMGGYEYTPMEMNKRSNESLASKQNEALKVMPVLFDENDFDVTVCDPTYANYQWIPDLSIYDDYPDIKSYITKGKFSDQSTKEYKVENSKRRFFCYSIMKVIPLCFQQMVYDEGNYNQSNDGLEADGLYVGQTITGIATAEGLYSVFMDAYNVLDNLSEMTRVENTRADKFLLMTNDTTHEPILLQTPGYIPQEQVDNTEYDAANQERFTVDGVTLDMGTDWQMTHYHANMAAMLRLGEWFDYLRENDVYDNTRIILTSDHGQNLDHANEFLLEDGQDKSLFNPILMVKDFGGEEFAVSKEFMTNADVPSMALDGIIDNPVNPFTGKKIDSSEKTSHEQYVLLSYEWDTEVNNGNTFLPGKWYSVHDDMWDNSNWKVAEENGVLMAE